MARMDNHQNIALGLFYEWLRLGASNPPERRTGSNTVDFEYSAKTRELMQRVDDFMQQHIYPVEAEHDEFVHDPANRWVVPPIDGRPQGQGARRRALEPVPAARIRQVQPGPHQPRVRAARRTHGSRRMVVRGVQLQCAGHRQHGSARALWQRGTTGALAEASARRNVAVGLLDDRTTGRFVRCDERANARSCATAPNTC